MGSAGGTRMGATPPPHYVCILIMCAVGVQGDDSPLSQLRQSIFFGYDRNVMPQVNGTDSDPLEVHLGLAPTWMDLDSNGVLEAIMWLRLTWSDYRLSWDPEDHENITVLESTPMSCGSPTSPSTTSRTWPMGSWLQIPAVQIPMYTSAPMAIYCGWSQSHIKCYVK